MIGVHPWTRSTAGRIGRGDLLGLQTLASKSLTARSLSSSNNNKKDKSSYGKGTLPQKPHNASVYVHPLSQIVLLYFQRECHDWICSKRLDRNLTLHRDGSFILRAKQTGSNKSPRIWTYYDPADKKHWLSYSSTCPENDNKSIGRQEEHRFLLQDNLMPAWHKRKSLSDQVQESVRELIKVVDHDLAHSDPL